MGGGHRKKAEWEVATGQGHAGMRPFAMDYLRPLSADFQGEVKVEADLGAAHSTAPCASLQHSTMHALPPGRSHCAPP